GRRCRGGHGVPRWRVDTAMIKRFHVLYVGQVELENIGLHGTPADARRYSNERLSEPFFAARDVAQLMDELGYYALWTAEHHGKRYDCPPPVDYRGYQLTEITCVPRPKHLPVEIWMPIASSKSIDYMASKNFKAMVTLNGETILDNVVRAYRDACAKYGRPKQ